MGGPESLPSLPSERLSGPPVPPRAYRPDIRPDAARMRAPVLVPRHEALAEVVERVGHEGARRRVVGLDARLESRLEVERPLLKREVSLKQSLVQSYLHVAAQGRRNLRVVRERDGLAVVLRRHERARLGLRLRVEPEGAYERDRRD